MQGRSNRLGILGRDSEKSESGPLWLPTALLPIAKRRHADPDHESKLLLRLTQPRAYGLHVLRLEGCHAARLQLPATDLTGLLYALLGVPGCRVLYFYS